MYNGSIATDVLGVQYNSTHVVVRTNSVPSYSIGPFSKVNAVLGKNRYYAFSLTPSKASQPLVVSLGAAGLWIDGVALYNGYDAQVITTVWHKNAYWWQGSTFDSCLGHPGLLSFLFFSFH